MSRAEKVGASCKGVRHNLKVRYTSSHAGECMYNPHYSRNPSDIRRMPSSPAGLSLPNPQRIRVYIVRLPFFTRIIVLALILSWIASLVVSSLVSAGALIPSTVSIFAGTCADYLL